MERESCQCAHSVIFYDAFLFLVCLLLRRSPANELLTMYWLCWVIQTYWRRISWGKSCCLARAPSPLTTTRPAVDFTPFLSLSLVWYFIIIYDSFLFFFEGVRDEAKTRLDFFFFLCGRDKVSEVMIVILVFDCRHRKGLRLFKKKHSLDLK